MRMGARKGEVARQCMTGMEQILRSSVLLGHLRRGSLLIVWHGLERQGLVHSGAFYCNVASEDSTANAPANWNLRSLHFKISQVPWAIATFPIGEVRCNCSMKNSHTHCSAGLNISQHPGGLSVATSSHSKCHMVCDCCQWRRTVHTGTRPISMTKLSPDKTPT